jgi:hypothetical protein
LLERELTHEVSKARLGGNRKWGKSALGPARSISCFTPMLSLSPSIHKFDDVFIYSGLNAALGHEPFGREPLGHEPFGRELRVERLEAEWSERLLTFY